MKDNVGNKNKNKRKLASQDKIYKEEMFHPIYKRDRFNQIKNISRKDSKRSCEEYINSYNSYNSYNQKIITKQKNEINVKIENQQSNLYVSCFFYKQNFKIIFDNNYTLNKLKEVSDYYKQFNNIRDIIIEFSFNILNEKSYIVGDENTALIILLPGHIYRSIGFTLKKNKNEL